MTSKLVEDSLKWQKECSSQPQVDSPKDSPAKKRPQTLLPTAMMPGSVSLQDGTINCISLKGEKSAKNLETLDPNAIEDVERYRAKLACNLFKVRTY